MNTDCRRMEEKSLFTIECKDVLLREWIPSDLDRFHSLTWQPEPSGSMANVTTGIHAKRNRRLMSVGAMLVTFIFAK